MEAEIATVQPEEGSLGFHRFLAQECTVLLLRVLSIRVLDREEEALPRLQGSRGGEQAEQGELHCLGVGKTAKVSRTSRLHRSESLGSLAAVPRSAQPRLLQNLQHFLPSGKPILQPRLNSACIRLYL